jgi:hypothetical protein
MDIMITYGLVCWVAPFLRPFTVICAVSCAPLPMLNINNAAANKKLLFNIAVL